MSDYESVHNAVADALEKLHERDFNANDAVVHIHPNAWRDAVNSHESPFQIASQTILGCEVIKNANLPKSLVVAVDTRQIPYSNGAIAFGEVEK